ncbi:hypothetical protein ACIQ7S_18745 [Streptomyces griseoluteus]|uniref:hypothetical protein n=1 Tax=Streptomyces griseoluteus TaxID=29306 RepID=UPI00380AF9F1
MTILIVGGSGFLGAELVRQAAAGGRTTAATFATRPGTTPEVAWHALDLRDGRPVREGLPRGQEPVGVRSCKPITRSNSRRW